MSKGEWAQRLLLFSWNGCVSGDRDLVGFYGETRQSDINYSLSGLKLMFIYELISCGKFIS